jgi:hypothetical protein
MADYNNNEPEHQAKNYSFDVQKLYIEMLLADAESFARAQNVSCNLSQSLSKTTWTNTK